MMKLFSVRDKLSQVYSEPHQFANSKVAIRDFAVAVNSPQSDGVPFGDLELYYVGEFDEKSGRFKSAHDFICVLSDLKQSPVKEDDNIEDVPKE